jgi:hypothetical protein
LVGSIYGRSSLKSAHLPTKFWFIWPSGFRGEDFFKSANQKQELPVVAMFGDGFNILFSKPCQKQYELLPSLGVRRLSSVIFSSENPQPNLTVSEYYSSNIYQRKTYVDLCFGGISLYN